MDAQEARARVMEPTIGRNVQVVGGRKVPKGTVGSVFYRRDGRIGIRTPTGETYFVDERHVCVVYPNLSVGEEPLDWVAFHDATLIQEQVVLSKYAHFNVGDVGVTVQTTDKKFVAGTLWWRKERRISIRLSDAKTAQGTWADVVWADVTDIVHKENLLPLALPSEASSIGTNIVAPYDGIRVIEVRGDEIKALGGLEETLLEFPATAILDALPYLRDDVLIRVYPKP